MSYVARWWTTVAVLISIFATGCGESITTPDAGTIDAGQADAGQADTGTEDAAVDTDAGPICGPPQLCARTIGECGLEFTQESCEAFYAAPDSCAEIDGYTECNCDCFAEPTCDEYFDCGMLCFEDWC